ncbi:cation:proton antiporter [Pelagicoccus sp. SDUM812003]|uniref:cation:proton antiporter domain-containing protein n=1 Tax=Pelagicoccus sp. SDUM812003 TaxID=3041267 RepID=UPI00280D470D|nr:cation:proton antiporter [Pelagicoccus sp. SDUM812003]MDQ8202070.1 cation:proton antiporter [Pelagicoccus sp. SDUM812003]
MQFLTTLPLAASANVSPILSDLAWIMLAASVAALISSRIKLPSLLGYLFAGFFLGPNLGLWPPIVTLSNVQDLSELGVVFLMFYIGLEFNMQKVRKVFAPAGTALVLQTLLMLFIGVQASSWLGLSTMDGWFLGGLLSISSSMVSVKLMRENGSFNRQHGQQAVGILVFEDILAILLLVLLNGMASSGSFDYAKLGQTAFFIGLFIVAVFLIGTLGAKRLVRVLETRGTTEMITMATLGLIFGVSLIAEQFQFSWALGGFLAGAILPTAGLGHRIESLTEPLRDLFCALFFVTVGMLIEPQKLWENATAILLLSAVVIVGKFAACWLGLFVAGQHADVAGRASLIKSQIGEFSFVITAIGAKYGATSPELQSIASGVAFVTILLTPVLIGSEKAILGAIERSAPKALKEFTQLYAQWQDTLEVSFNRSFLKLAKKPVLRILLYFLIINAIIIGAALVSAKLEKPDFVPISDGYFQQAVFLLSLLLSLPFFVDTVRSFNVLVLLFSDAALSRPLFQQFSKGAFRSVFNGLILLLLLFVYGLVFLIVAAPYFPTGSIFLVFAIAACMLGVVFWKNLVHMHNNWEMAFIQAMENESRSQIEKRIENNLTKLQSKNPWKVDVEAVDIHKTSRWCGKEIREIDLRRQTGATIAGIERSGFDLTDLMPHSRIFPHDKLFLLGEPQQITAARSYLNQKRSSDDAEPSPFTFSKESVPPFSPWDGLSIKDTHLRSDHGVTIVGIQRDGQRIVSPSPDQLLHVGDLLLLMGCEDKLAQVGKLLTTEAEHREEAVSTS